MSDVIMALGDPLQISAVSRLSNPKASLAAMGVVKALANFLESPIIMILQTSTALSGDRGSRRCLAGFVVMLALLCSGTFLLLNLPGCYEWVFLSLFGATPEVAQAARWAMLWMVFWPALIAWRRYYQGIMIGAKEGRWLGWASIGRLRASDSGTEVKVLRLRRAP
jgi:Na+-driven multidrug efflux pump